MKINKKIKLAIILSIFGTLSFLASTKVNAAGAYGSNIETIDTNNEIHEPVDAGVEDLIPQAIIALTALSGLATTSILIKKLK